MKGINRKFEYNEDNFWLKMDGTFWIRGRPLGCGYQYIKVVDEELIKELNKFVEEG